MFSLRHRKKISFAFLAVWLVFLPQHLATFAEDAEKKTKVTLIVNHSVSQDHLSKEDIRNIYLGKKTRWSNGNTIHFVTLKEGEVHEEFLRIYLSKTAKQYDNYWKKQIFTGQGAPPKSFPSEEELLKYIATTKDTIGYVGKITELGETVKQVTIQE